MAKSSRPDRRRDGRRKEPSEFAEATLSIDRVTRVVKGGRRMRFRAIVVTGNRKGKVGLGTGKATEVQAAIRKASSAAKRAMMRVPIKEGTIPHTVEIKFKAARIRIMPALPGTGIIAGGALRVILDHAGVKNCLSKRFGSRNKLVNAQATMLALKMLRPVSGAPAEEVSVAGAPVVPGKEPASTKDIFGPGYHSPEAAPLDVKEISKKEAEESITRAKRNELGK
ncbi:MAG: 30S ribosomal protein S5 [Candidatus Peribacteraceae bacterium]|jgi:small subunit ribosomal protein S5